MSASVEKAAPALERYRHAFEQRQQRWSTRNALSELRRTALDEFLAVGFPTQRHEDWKYTNLRRLETRSFALPEPGWALDSTEDPWIADAGDRIVFINGRLAPTLSSAPVLPPGVTVATLGQWMVSDSAVAASVLASIERPTPLEQLNLAFAEDGVVISLADGAQPDRPLYVVHHWTQGAPRMNHPRLILRAGPHARCTLIEHFTGASDAECFTNAVTTIDAASGAHIDHYRLQEESLRTFHLGHIAARLETDSRYACWDIAFGASLSRLSINTVLDGRGGHAQLRGLFTPAGSQHLDAHTRIDHSAPHTTSDENYRGIATDRGRGVFNGKVIVRPGAQKVDARQSSRNLLLSATAEINTKPELEIYAHDVKCSHGATTGQLDAAALFYLRSRGVSEQQARGLLVRAFAESILAPIAHAPVRGYLEQRLDERFAALTEGV